MNTTLPRRQRPALIITGMHRSGTSILAIAVRELGIPIGPELLAATEHSPAGYGEDIEFLELHRRLFGATWPDGEVVAAGDHHDWGYDLAGTFDPSVFEAERAAVDELLDRPGVGPWAFKDPRTTLFLDNWVRRLADPRVLLVVRSPDQVARSMRGLGQPDWLDPAIAHRIWRFYNRRVLDFAQRATVPCVVVDGSIAHAGPRAVAQVLREHLHLDVDTDGITFGHLDTHRFDTSGTRDRLGVRDRLASDLLWRRLRRVSAWMS